MDFMTTQANSRFPKRVLVALSLLVIPLSTHAVAGSDHKQEQSSHYQQHEKRTTKVNEQLGIIAPSATCESLLNTDLVEIGGEGSAITRVAVDTHDGYAACIVEGNLAPEVGFKVVLPTETWRQRYLQVGCGGLCGSIGLSVSASDGCVPLTNGGFVLASTNMGHDGRSAEFGNDPQKRVDFAYRGVHLTSLAAKRLIETYYGTPEKYAYFSGCSDGGREALMEAQRYPDDFDGIVAGAPAMNFQVQNNIFHPWQAQSNMDENGQPVLLAARLPILHDAVLAECDGLDGLEDGIVSDPTACSFDPASIVCPINTTDTSSCLTAAEADVATKFYQGAHDPDTGAQLTLGGPQYGSELSWAGVYVSDSVDQSVFSQTIASGTVGYVSFPENMGTAFDMQTYPVTSSTLEALRALHPLYDATNPDLSQFKRNGGKLIMWHGWSDPHISPMNTIAYHNALQRQLGKRAVSRFERLYIVPGMYHCGSGEGPEYVDFLTPIMDWVEQGVAPDDVNTYWESQVVTEDTATETTAEETIEAATIKQSGKQKESLKKQHKGKSGGKTSVAQSYLGRPVFPYPHVASYDGTGDVTDGTQFVRGNLLSVYGQTLDWAGSDLFVPYRAAE